MNKETNRTYIIKACIMSTLLAVAFVIRDYFIHGYQLGYAKYNGIDRISFFEWLMDYRNYGWMLLIGLVLIVVPYEAIGGRLKNGIEGALEKKKNSRILILSAAMIVMLAIMGLVAMGSGNDYQQTFAICVVGVSMLICVALRQLFTSEISWLIYAALYNVLGYLVFKVVVEHVKVAEYNSESALMQLYLTEKILFIVFVAAGIALFCYSVGSDEKNRTVGNVIISLISSVIIPGIVMYGELHFPSRLDDHVKVVADKYEILHEGLEADLFNKTLFTAVPVSLAVIAILMAVCCVLLPKKEKLRKMIVCWCMLIVVLIVLYEILSHFGVVSEVWHDCLSFKNSLMVLVFIVIRAFVMAGRK